MLLTYLDEQKIRESNDFISIYDTDLRVTEWNRACEQKFGIPREAAIQRTINELFPYVKNDYRVNCLHDAVKQGKSFFFPGLPYLYRDGSYYQVIIPVRKDPENIIGVLNIVRDSSQDKTK